MSPGYSVAHQTGFWEMAARLMVKVDRGKVGKILPGEQESPGYSVTHQTGFWEMAARLMVEVDRGKVGKISFSDHKIGGLGAPTCAPTA